MRENKANMGPPPIQDDIHVGADGQLWRWNHGQVLVAHSGQQTADYAKKHNWPKKVVHRLQRKGRIV